MFKFRGDPSAFDLYQLTQNLYELKLPTIELKKLNLQIEIDASVPRFLIGDVVKLHRILLNLLGNAIKFTEKGFIRLHVQSSPARNAGVLIDFSLQDTGIGMEEKIQRKIFKRFYRASPSHKGRYAGHGVGLHIVQKYTRLLKGKINLDSRLGQGSTFYLTLPLQIDSAKNVNEAPHNASFSFLAPNAPSATEQKNQETAPHPIAKRKNQPFLLLIEDNPIALTIIESISKQANCRYLSATSAEKALELVEMHHFDLILSDIGLPGLSGNEFATHVRAKEKENNQQPIPIIGLTAHALKSAEADSMEAGMNHIVMKPMRLDVFHQLLKEYLPCCCSHHQSAFKTLGIDLPQTEAELFQLDSHPLLHLETSIENLGSLETAKDMLSFMIHEALPDDRKAITKAYEEDNWEQVERLAHKIKSSALYCGTTRLKWACQYLERYRKAGHSQSLKPLYHQFQRISEETHQAIASWLRKIEEES